MLGQESNMRIQSASKQQAQHAECGVNDDMRVILCVPGTGHKCFAQIFPPSHPRHHSELLFFHPSRPIGPRPRYHRIDSYFILHSSSVWRNGSILAVSALRFASIQQYNLPRKWIVGSLDRCPFGTLLVRFVQAFVRLFFLGANITQLVDSLFT
jgi:hypothetical protein